tara:strand:- start:16699 stop:17841 length:1143 start_codon:yes stop_codon:yes gene_type:complete
MPSVPLDERKRIAPCVKNIVEGMKTALKDSTMPLYTWATKAVTTPTYPVLRWMESLVYDQNQEAFQSEFSSWRDSVPSMGKRLVFHTVDNPKGEREALDLDEARVDVPGHSPEQIKEWFLCQNSCDTYSFFVSAALQLMIAGGCAPVHALKDGTPLELVGVDTMVGCVQLAFSGMAWSDDGTCVRGLRAFASPEALKEKDRENHCFLRFKLRNTMTDQVLFMFCDTTARQVVSDLALTDKAGAPQHVKMWPDGTLPSQYTMYGKPRVKDHDELLFELEGVDGPCQVAAFLYSLHKMKANIECGGAKKMTPEQKGSYDTTWQKAMDFLTDLSPVSINWDDALARVEERKIYDNMEAAGINGQVIMTRDPVTREWKRMCMGD